MGGGYGRGGGGERPRPTTGGGSGEPSASEGGYSGGRSRGGGPKEDFVEGKLFLGGLDTNTTKDILVEYCQQW